MSRQSYANCCKFHSSFLPVLFIIALVQLSGHATLAARLTPYMNANCNNWDVYLHTNANREVLKLSPGVYIYLTDESGSSARKLRNPFNGPYVVDQT